jgi:hypothetical protein
VEERPENNLEATDDEAKFIWPNRVTTVNGTSGPEPWSGRTALLTKYIGTANLGLAAHWPKGQGMRISQGEADRAKCGRYCPSVVQLGDFCDWAKRFAVAVSD